MANILSMKDVVSIPGVKVTYDSTKERALIVHFNNCIYKFKECAEGLYYYDTAAGCISVPVKLEAAKQVQANPQSKLNEEDTPYSFYPP